MFLNLTYLDGTVRKFTSIEDCFGKELIEVDGHYFLYDGCRNGFCFREVQPFKVY